MVYAEDPGDLQSSLDKLKIPALSEPAAATLDDVYAQMEQLGQATGHADEAAGQADALETRIKTIVDSVGDAGKGMTYYYELDDTYYSVTSDTFIGAVLGELGMKNIADAAKGASSGTRSCRPSTSCRPNPDLILLADTKCCGQDAEKVAKRPGWQDLTAVQHGGVVELDDDVASRWGPRIADLLQQVGDAVQAQAQADWMKHAARLEGTHVVGGIARPSAARSRRRAVRWTVIGVATLFVAVVIGLFAGAVRISPGRDPRLDDRRRLAHRAATGDRCGASAAAGGARGARRRRPVGVGLRIPGARSVTRSQIRTCWGRRPAPGSGATIVIVLGVAMAPLALPAAAFAGALGGVGLAYLMALHPGRRPHFDLACCSAGSRWRRS